MRTAVVSIVLLVLTTTSKAQTIIHDRLFNPVYGSSFPHYVPAFDSSLHKKWLVSKYAGFSAGYSFFKGGSASVMAVPIGLQLNRKLTNNVYAFAGVSVAPAYVNINSPFIPGNFYKPNFNNTFSKTGSLNMFSRAELGLTYMNDAKTFFISGSVGVERSSTPVFYNSGTNATKPNANSPLYR